MKQYSCELIDDIKLNLKMITKWLTFSGLGVNKSKSELRLFHTIDHPSKSFSIKKVEIKLMRFRLTNRIIDDSDFKAVNFVC